MAADKKQQQNQNPQPKREDRTATQPATLQRCQDDYRAAKEKREGVGQ